MKKALLLLPLCVILTACGGTKKVDSLDVYPDAYSQETPVVEKVEVENFEAETVETVGLNEPCSETILCKDGLLCAKNEGQDSPSCKIADQRPELTCDDKQYAPVCAKSYGEKRTYQNECFADKAGADVKKEGPCEE